VTCATAAPATAQLTEDDAIRIIRVVYDQEGFDTGGSTRDQLNAFLMRAVASHISVTPVQPDTDPAGV
jgi:hypothetical protein